MLCTIALAAQLSGSPLDSPYVEVSKHEVEADPDWIQYDTGQQSSACFAAAGSSVARGVVRAFEFDPPKSKEVKVDWCRNLGRRLYEGHNQRFILPAVLKQLINEIYAHLSEHEGESDVSLWLSKHRWCINAYKRVCF